MDSEMDERSEAFERGLKTMERVALELYQRGRASAAEELESVKRERDEALARCETLRELADAAAYEQGLAQRRMMDAQRERDEARERANTLAINCESYFQDSCRIRKERDEARASVADSFRRGAAAMREACARSIQDDTRFIKGSHTYLANELRALPIPEDK